MEGSPDDLTGDFVFSVPSGTFQGELRVSLGTTAAGAEIRYTTDGTRPGADAARYHRTPLLLAGTTQLRAQAFLDGAPSGDPFSVSGDRRGPGPSGLRHADANLRDPLDQSGTRR